MRFLAFARQRGGEGLFCLRKAAEAHSLTEQMLVRGTSARMGRRSMADGGNRQRDKAAEPSQGECGPGCSLVFLDVVWSEVRCLSLLSSKTYCGSPWPPRWVFKLPRSRYVRAVRNPLVASDKNHNPKWLN